LQKLKVNLHRKKQKTGSASIRNESVKCTKRHKIRHVVVTSFSLSFKKFV
jgi:hypothetical protein